MSKHKSSWFMATLVTALFHVFYYTLLYSMIKSWNQSYHSFMPLSFKCVLLPYLFIWIIGKIICMSKKNGVQRSTIVHVLVDNVRSLWTDFRCHHCSNSGCSQFWLQGLLFPQMGTQRVVFKSQLSYLSWSRKASVSIR